MVMKRRWGFALVEVMIVFAVLSILFGGAIFISTKIGHANMQENMFMAEVDLTNLNEGILLFTTIEGTAPTSINELFRLGYVRGTNQTPWGGHYQIHVGNTFPYAWCSMPDGTVLGKSQYGI
jgi:competence protein ComGC